MKAFRELDPPAEEREALLAELEPLVRRLIRALRGIAPEFGGSRDGGPPLPPEAARRDWIRRVFHALIDAYDPTDGVPLRPYLTRGLAAAVHATVRTARTPPPSWGMDHPDLERRLFDPATASLPAALECLPRRQRAVIAARLASARSLEDVARELGVSPAAARRLLRQGLRRLSAGLGARVPKR